MSRSLKKGPFTDERLLKKIRKLKLGTKTVVKTWSRTSVITPEMVGFTIAVHNGRTHVPVSLVEDMVGFRLGEFIPTKKFVRHGGKLQREVEAKTQTTAVPTTPATEKK